MPQPFFLVRDDQMKPQRTRISAYGLVTNADYILLCRISNALPRWEGQWTLPGGGIEFAEDPKDAMVREVKEETGLVVLPKTVAAVNSIYDDSQDIDFHGIRIIYHTDFLSGALRDEINGTTDQCRWWTRTELEFLELVDIAHLGVQLAFDT